MLIPFHDPQQKTTERTLLAALAVLATGCLLWRVFRHR